MCLAGSSAADALGERVVCARRLLVPVPAFSEYRRVCAQQDFEYVPFPLDRSAYFRVPVDSLCRRFETELCDLVLLNNPHNPSGALLDAHEVRRILCAARSTGARRVRTFSCATPRE